MRLNNVLIAAIALSATSVQADDVSIEYMMWEPDQLEIERAAIAEFEAANPGVKVDVQAMAPKEYWPKMSSLAASGDLPDVFAMSSGFVKEWAAAGNLADLSEIVAETDLGSYFDGALSVGLAGDERVAFPQNWVAPVLYYNKSMFDDAGLQYPTADWTWDQFREAAKALTLDKDSDGTIDQWGMWLYGRYAHIDAWVFRNGGRYLNADETAIDINDEAVSALTFLNDLIQVDKAAPMPQEMEGVRQQDVFPLGMAAMWVDGSWNIANTRDVAGDNFAWGIAQVPLGPDASEDTAAAYAWADMLSVNASSEHKDVAWAFIQHMVGEGRSAADFLGGKVPAYRAIAESDAWLENDQQPDNKAVILEIGAQPVYTGFSRKWSDWRGYVAEGAGGMNGELDEVFNGRKTLDEAIIAITDYGNEVLSR